MPRKQRRNRRRKKARSPDQKAWTDAVGAASRVWEQLTDQQRLELNVEAESNRTSGQRWFVKLNARRLFNEQPLVLRNPRVETFSRPLRFRFVITNLGGRIAFKLEFSKRPVGSFTIWASRPRNRGASRERNYPRLGPLPRLENGVTEFTELYFRKHGAYIRRHRVQLAGKRIFLRLREEREDGPGLIQAADAVVPAA